MNLNNSLSIRCEFNATAVRAEPVEAPDSIHIVKRLHALAGMTAFTIGAFFLSLLLTPSVQAAEVVAGKIGYMSGNLVAKRADGTVRIMGPKSEVMAGDMLETAKESYAQVVMNDGSKMTLRPQSNLKIEAFQFNVQAPQEDNFAIRLLKGGFRTLSGLIGKRGNPDAYQLKAATATIGIRGTDFTTRLCNQDCGDEANAVNQPAAPAPIPAAPNQSPETPQPAAAGTEPGVYVTVHDGQVIMAQGSGKSIDLVKGQTGFANDKLITHLPETPRFMTTDKPIEVKENTTAPNKPGAEPGKPSAEPSKTSTAPSKAGCEVK